MASKPKYDPNPKPGDQERRFAEEPAPGMVDGKLDTVTAEEFARMKGSAPLGGDSAGPTMEMTEAGYIDGPVKRQPCNLCSMYLGKNRCLLVIGDISPRGHCDHWKDGDLELLELLEAADRV